jgi:actin-related protein
LSVYDKLKANPEEHPAVLTEKPFMPNKTRESMAELFFEKFNVPSMYFGLSAVFSMYALGTITGTLVQLHTAPHCCRVHVTRVLIVHYYRSRY